MPALSKKQQKFFGIVRAIQKGEQAPTTPETAKAAADMKKSDVKKFASTKHKGLPEKKKVEEMYNDQGNGKEQKQIETKQRRANQLKKQVLMKKIQAVRSGAGSEIMASNNLEGEVIEGYGNPNVGTALKIARLIDKTKPGPRSKRAKISRYFKRKEMDADKKKYAAVGEENKMVEESNPRIPRKKGQPANSKKHSDLYTDENPKGTIHGLGFKDVATAKASVAKIRKSNRSHAHKIQAAVAMEQRAREMGKTSEAAVYRKFINSMKKKTKAMKESYGPRTKKPNFPKVQIKKKDPQQLIQIHFDTSKPGGGFDVGVDLPVIGNTKVKKTIKDLQRLPGNVQDLLNPETTDSDTNKVTDTVDDAINDYMKNKKGIKQRKRR